MDCGPDPPDWSYVERRALVTARFPGLGFYDLPDIRVGDATDDLADIIGDLAAATWRRQNTSDENALWHLLFTHQSHWGQHLEDLRRYLHACAARRP